MTYNQEIATAALRREAAKTLRDAAYEIEHKDATLETISALVDRAMNALAMSLPEVRTEQEVRRAVALAR